MEATVTNNDGTTIVYAYAPEHYAGVNLYYAQALAAGEIEDYSITRDSEESSVYYL